MKIRFACKEDAKGIAKVHVKTWRTAYRGIVPDEVLDVKLSIERSKKNWERTLTEMKDSIFLVAATDNNEIVGFVSGGFSRDEKLKSDYEGELMAIYILQEYQSQGIGSELMKSFVQELSEKKISSMIICCLQENKYQNFYKKLGGKLIAEKDYKIGGKELKGNVYGFSIRK